MTTNNDEIMKTYRHDDSHEELIDRLQRGITDVIRLVRINNPTNYEGSPYEEHSNRYFKGGDAQLEHVMYIDEDTIVFEDNSDEKATLTYTQLEWILEVGQKVLYEYNRVSLGLTKNK